ncbi:MULTISPECIES: TerC family protein [unclassified Paenibacillus]|uniref:TerC family protein n=1 Tax=unclassified Paenibacillus TaxID=185978 RepID=UPI001AE32014|nr:MULTISPECIES: TerC family protein [unclassified Paenibacillus]MBP1156306.1 YjbE family integral membrane protein [Paenibacillus sp. PvP091]MBP1168308.1 YjbE family integral membrane protein [Paenibacillus sp. PvR098]MBP2439336.1 YjbE family integral membrane protein [Paenibacillus sp. PvP052]
MIEWIVLFLQIMLINIVLSGDNAVVIALASKKLPLEERKKAIWWGTFGAIGIRIILTLAAVYVLQVPYIQTAGSVLLLWIAIKLMMDEEDHSNVKEASTLGKAIWTIIVADFVMSLDNVLAIAAKAEGEIGIIILGIAMSVPIIVWGSTLVVNLLKKFPVLVFVGAGILGYTAGEMFMADHQVSSWLLGNISHYVLPVITTLIVIGSGLLKKFVLTPRSS